MESVPIFYLTYLKNKNVYLGLDMMPIFQEITVKIARLYYETENKQYKANAMALLSYINTSEKYSMLLDNV